MAKSPRGSAPQLSLIDSPRAARPAAAPPARKSVAVPVTAAVEPAEPPAQTSVAPPSVPEPPPKPARRATAESMAQKQREISISEFFTKNRHLLGFDNPSKALLTTIKEAVDNSLDACEEAGILPEVEVEIVELGGDRYQVAVEDNGPGIVKAQIPKVFGKLLYGSKFHRLKQSRGQQGIGISAAVMYGQLTTGKPARVLSRTEPGKPAHQFLIRIDTRKNAPDADDREVKWQRPLNPMLTGTASPEAKLDPDFMVDKPHGTRVEIELTANFVNGQRSVLRYLEQTSLANPHATIRYFRPKTPPLELPASTHELPPEATEIMPHPHGIELGVLMSKLQETDEKTLTTFLQKSFSRISSRTAEDIVRVAGLGPRVAPRRIPQAQAEALHKALVESKVPPPPTNCLAPIGDLLMRQGLKSFLSVIDLEDEMDQEAIAREAQLSIAKARDKQQPSSIAEAPAEGSAAAGAPAPEATGPTLEEGEEQIKGRRYFLATVTRPPKVYRGNPFQVEVGLAYGGTYPADKTVELYRMANRVPLLFQRGACGITEAVTKTDWRNYELTQPKGSLPVGPMAVLVHIASVWVPFTSESKEAIAHYPDILSEVKLALQDCGRKLGTYLRKIKRARQEGERRDRFQLYIDELARSLHHLTGLAESDLREVFTAMSVQVTAGADFEKMLEEAERKRTSKSRESSVEADE